MEKVRRGKVRRMGKVREIDQNCFLFSLYLNP
jgi:hypothetical protein